VSPQPHTDAAQPLVLVIDDDRVIRMVVREALEGAGLRVIEAEDGESGIAQAREHAPDVMILDIMLPRVDGLTMLSSLVEAGRGSRVLVFSATGSRSAERAMELGAADYMSKPFELHDLVHRVTSLLARGRSAA
jgi:two-component system, OmpR family, response regulator MprA